MKNSSSVFEDWAKLTKDLRESGVRENFFAVLKMLLVAARSRNDLRRLHDEALERNLRLRREDLQVVETFWLNHFKPEQPGKTEPLDSMLAYFLLNHEADQSSLEGYHCRRIEVAANKVYRTLGEFTYNGEGWKNILSDPNRSGHGEYHYLVTMFGQNYGLGCWVGPKSVIRVSIQIWSRDLTERLTHDLTSKLPQFDVVSAGSSSVKGICLGLVYDIDGSGLVEKLEKGPTEGSLGPSVIGPESFAEALFQRLVEIGLPVTRRFVY